MCHTLNVVQRDDGNQKAPPGGGGRAGPSCPACRCGGSDKNAWGVPTEPYGFSNNAEGFLGPPSFADAAILLDGSDTSITIAFIYHGGGSPELTGPLAETE